MTREARVQDERRGGGSSSAPAFGRSGQGRLGESLLPNGLRIITEAIPGVRSVALGVWVRQGSAHESEEERGASHLLEHMVFKGTENRTPKEIVMALERLGGSLDAFTSREHTSYQARVMSEHLPVALDVVSDLVLHPLLREEDLELEREVVLEEISTVEDTPDDLVFDLHGELLRRARASRPRDQNQEREHRQRGDTSRALTHARHLLLDAPTYTFTPLSS